MIDKLDLRVPGVVPLTREFAAVYASTMGDPKRWRSSKHYAKTASFEDCGYPVILHMDCMMTKKNLHKIEILQTGEKTIGEMRRIAGSIFDCDPGGMGIMRLDLTADVEGVSVDWFKRHTLVQFKKTTRQHFNVETGLTVRKGTAETLYAGVKPNQIRIYDKTAERRMQYSKYLAKFIRATSEMPDSFEVEPTSFEAMFGISERRMITRVERQVAARDIEKLGITTVQSLQRIDSVRPFANMIFFDTPTSGPSLEGYSFHDKLAIEALQTRIHEFGISETLAWMRSQTGKNFLRAKERYGPFLRVNENVVGIDSDRLNRIFKASASNQLLRAA